MSCRADGAAHGHSHRRRVFGCRRRLDARRSLRRGATHRATVAARELSRRRDDHRCGQGDRCAGDSPGVRLPVGKRGFCRGGLRGRAGVHRTAARRDSRDGIEVRIETDHGPGRRAAGARLSRRGPGRFVAHARSGRDGLSGADQGVGRRWRQGHAHRRAQRGLRRRARVRAARGEGGIRRRYRAAREIPDRTSTYRTAGIRGHARQLRAPVRTRLLGAADGIRRCSKRLRRPV